MKPIADMAEIALEHPEKIVVGTLAHSSRFGRNEGKSVHMHFTDILRRAGVR